MARPRLASAPSRVSSWKAGVSYTHYYGNAAGFLNAAFTNTFQQNMKDRDFVSFTITRTF